MGYMLIWVKIAEVGYYLCGFFLPAGMRVWVVYTHTRTRIPDGYKNSSNNVPTGAKCLPYPPPYRVKLVGYSGFGYPLPSWVETCKLDASNDGVELKIQILKSYL